MIDEISPAEPTHEVISPVCQTRPLVLASPHSGDRYAAEFLAASRLDPCSLRKSEDCFVHEIFASAPDQGVPLLRALFPRAYLDVNREAYELDPAMFSDHLPNFVNTRSSRVAAGLGTIAKIVADGENIYRDPLTFAEAKQRIATHYVPYHNALRALVDGTVAQFGHAILIDCHSMPSTPPGERDDRRADIVLGDCHGSACSAALTATAERVLRGFGYVVRRNNPYAGGYTTRHYGRPRQSIHALQIEIGRELYMDERSLERLPFMDRLTRHMGELVAAIGAIPAEELRSKKAGA